MNKTFTCMVASLLLAGCGDDKQISPVPTQPDAQLAPRQSEFTDEELLGAVYSSDSAPPDMYADPVGPKYYENTVSLGQSSTEWRELCTDDTDQARQWTETAATREAASSHSQPTYIDAERQTEKFFEFKRVDPDSPSPGLAVYRRVHKCGYLDRSAYDAFNPGPELGTLNTTKPLTPDTAKDLGEYLWLLRYENIVGSKVLSSFTDDHADFIEHSLYETWLVGGDWGGCDTIGLQHRSLQINKSSGTLLEFTETLRTITGKCN